MKWINTICISTAVLIALSTSACNREPSGTTATSQPATQAATPSSAADDKVTFTIDNKPFIFAAPQARLEKSAEQIVIYTAGKTPTGSLYLEIPIDTSDTGQTGWTSELRTPRDEREDTIVGINLAQANQTLQPILLKATVMPLSDTLMQFEISGTFLVYPEDSTVASAKVDAQATFVSRVRCRAGE